MTTLASAFRVVYARNELVVTNSVASELKVSVFDVQVSIDEALEKITSYYYKIDQRQSLRK